MNIFLSKKKRILVQIIVSLKILHNACSTMCSFSISTSFVPFLWTKHFWIKWIRITQVLVLLFFLYYACIQNSRTTFAMIFFCFRLSKVFKNIQKKQYNVPSNKRKICNNPLCSDTMLAQHTSIFRVLM